MKSTTPIIKLRDFLTDKAVTHESKDGGGSIGIAEATFPSRLIYAAFDEGVTHVRYLGAGVLEVRYPMLQLVTQEGSIFIESKEDKKQP